MITSKRQREIKYDQGMMASPAVGSLLFSLKEQDTKEGSKANNDRDYANLIDNCSKNVVICGSIVGGTGASVAPTLARDLHRKGAKVMAVLVHRWFEFRTNETPLEIERKAKKRNKEMVENAAGGLAYSGLELAGDLATVLVGVPESKLVLRDYGGDNKQACKDSYAHVIGALAAIRHLLSDEEEVGEGMYGISASNPSELTREIKIGEGKHSTLNDLVGQATCLVYVLELYCDALEKYEPRQFEGITGLLHLISTGSSESLQLRICKSVYDVVDKNILKVKDVARELKEIKGNYDSLLGWLGELNLEYRLSPGDEQFLKIQYNHLSRIREESLPPPLDGGRRGIKAGKELGEEEYIALALFHWLADWIKAWWEKGKPTQSSSDAVKLYWPPPVASRESQGAITGSSYPGKLGKIKSTDLARTLRDYFELNYVSPNGWPHPIAVADEYAFKIKQKDPIAARKLELLLLGRALHLLNLEKLNTEENRRGAKSGSQSVSIEKLIKKERPDLAQYRLVHHRTKKSYGFNSFETLLCPTPDTSNQEWGELWEEINCHTVLNDDWRTSEEWGYDARKARSCIATWIKFLGGYIQGNDCWKRLVEIFKSEKTIAFGISEWLPILGSEGKTPLPVYGNSIIPPDGFIENEIAYNDPKDKKIRDHIQGFDQYEGFEFIKDLPAPGEEHPQSMMWREHLDLLQEEHKIFAWWEDVERERIGVITEFQKEVIYIKNLRVIDLDDIRIETCIPLRQRPVPGSEVEENSLKFPDLPLLPEYIGLAKASPDKGESSWIHRNWAGMPDEPYKLDKRNEEVEWTLYLEGRSEPATIKLPYDGIEPAEAHWMIWPSFKAKNENEHPWKAYYIYESSTRELLEAKPILDIGKGKLSELKNRPKDNPGPSRAVEFDAREGIHTGGPPVALCAFDHERGENVGLYTVRLHEFLKSEPDDNNSEWKLAVDFGTSHTVAAVREDEDNNPITLTPELAPSLTNSKKKKKKLTLHISENWSRNPAKRSEMQLDLWRPTYVTEDEGAVLPSDLWSVKNINDVELHEVKECWEPMTHYLIPLRRLKREEPQEHSISGFKWQMTEKKFRGEESWLQEKYLGMAIEIFVASVVLSNEKLPRNIKFTFTYPLRGIYSKDTEKYENSINELLKSSRRDLGFNVSQGDLLYSESHAAAGGVGTGNKFEVKLVADLGGGTLDAFISTSDIDDKKESRFEESADSVRVGGERLLRIMAGQSDKYLPESWGKDYDTCLSNLRAWMRSEGSVKLLGKHAKSRSTDLNLQGFGNSDVDIDRANASRTLIDRYFELIVDFLARYLVAYVANEFWKNKKLTGDERRQLKLIVQLQGNGWRLWYDYSDYDKIQNEKIKKDIKERAEQLWERVSKDVESQISDLGDDVWHKPIGKPDPKLGPISNAVGKGVSPNDVDCYKFPLSEVSLQRKFEDPDSREWFQPLAFTVEDPKKTDLIIGEFNPPVVDSIGKIEDTLMSDINQVLEKQQIIFGKTLDAPVAAIIWESVFKSSEFQND